MNRVTRAFRAAQYRRMLRNMAGPRLLEAFAQLYPDAFFIEVGSNDGDQHDHLRPFILSRNWRGIMVEPVPYVFERLRRNYGGLDRITLVRAAIAEQDGQLEFFHLAEADHEERARLPEWYDGIGSFSRAAVASHAAQIPDIERRIVCETVPCLSFESLCRRHGADDVDLLLIDTEGYDWEILRTIDLEARRPRLVIFEHFHLRAGDRDEARAHLERAGYETMEEGFDTFCLDVRTADDLTRAWRRLRPAVRGVYAHEVAA